MTTEELAKLSPEEKRVKIHQARGYESFWNCPNHSEIDPPKCKWCGYEAELIDAHTFKPVPNYPGDLNAMSDAERLFDTNIHDPDSLRYVYSRHVYNICSPETQPFRATAAQRADAFILATNP